MKRVVSGGLLGVVLPFVLTAIVFFTHLVSNALIFILPGCIAVYSCINIILFILEKRKSKSILPQTWTPLSKRFYFILAALDIWLGWILYFIYYRTCVSTKVYLLFPLCALLIFGFSCISTLFPPNNKIGIHTPWSKYNQKVWDKSQKAGAIVTFALGSCVVFGTLTNSNITISATIFAVFFILDAIICIYISYYYYKQAQIDEKTKKVL